MQYTARTRHLTATVQEYDISLFVALELSRSIWLLAVSAPNSDKISKYRVRCRRQRDVAEPAVAPESGSRAAVRQASEDHLDPRGWT